VSSSPVSLLGNGNTYLFLSLPERLGFGIYLEVIDREGELHDSLNLTRFIVLVMVHAVIPARKLVMMSCLCSLQH
jgi:hypothetical protein